jgi:3-oxoacyl-[acyl-carrier protein] reductase
MSQTSPAGRVVLVTGGARGVGWGIAEAFADTGATVAVNDIAPDLALEAAERLASNGTKSLAVPFDVTDDDQVVAGVAQITDELGPVDILVNNVGTGPNSGPLGGRGTKFRDMDRSRWDDWLGPNFYGSLNCIRATLGSMSERGWGRVIQIISDAGSRGHPEGLVLYGAAKTAMGGAIRHLAIEEATSGVTANAISLGLMSNNLGRQEIMGEGRQGIGTLAGVPMGRFGEPAEVGACAVWLASDLAGYVTGQTIHLNGGTLHGL